MDVANVAERIGATVVQHEDFHQRDDPEHVENWDSCHLLQPRILHLAFPLQLVSQHDLAHRHGLAVHLEKKTLIHFAREVSSLIHCVHDDVNLIVGETVQNYHKIEKHWHEMTICQEF